MRYENFVTYGAVLPFRKTSFSTSRRYSLINNFGMTKRINYFLRYENFVTYGAVFAFRKTSLGTGRRYSLINNFGVTKRINYFLRYENFVTYGTVLTFRKTSFGTSRRYSLINNFGMAKSRNFVGNVAVTTSSTSVGRITNIRTGRRSYYGSITVTERRISECNIWV